MSRYAFNRVDKNQREIVKSLRKCGAKVAILASVGKDIPDLLVDFHGRLLLMEIKQTKGKLSEGQKEFVSTWSNTFVVRSIDEALKSIGVI